jgi:VIT1/CCC1 family predicted Fe2+/Mn2+ transporter
MPAIAQIGPLTTLLELAATSIGAGVVVFGLATSAVGMFLGRSRKELEGNALRHVFWGGIVGMLCLCIDLIVTHLPWN